MKTRALTELGLSERTGDRYFRLRASGNQQTPFWGLVKCFFDGPLSELLAFLFSGFRCHDLQPLYRVARLKLTND